MSDIIIGKNEDGMDVGRYGRIGAFGSLGQIQAMDILPPLVGGTVTLGTYILIRKYGKAHPNLVRFAPLLGAAGGVLGSVPLYWWRGTPAVVKSAVTSIITGGVLMGAQEIMATDWATSGIYARRLPAARGITTAYSPNRPGTRMTVGAMGGNGVPGGFDLEGFGASV